METCLAGILELSWVIILLTCWHCAFITGSAVSATRCLSWTYTYSVPPLPQRQVFAILIFLLRYVYSLSRNWYLPHGGCHTCPRFPLAGLWPLPLESGVIPRRQRAQTVCEASIPVSVRRIFIAFALIVYFMYYSVFWFCEHSYNGAI